MTRKIFAPMVRVFESADRGFGMPRIHPIARAEQVASFSLAGTEVSEDVSPKPLLRNRAG